MTGKAKGGTDGHLRRLRHPGPRAGLDHRPPDRGRPYRHDPPHQAWRQGLDQHLPGQARHREAGRDPHGFGQGQPRALGRRRQAGPDHVRAVVRRPEASPGRPSTGPSRSCRSRPRFVDRGRRASDGQARSRAPRARRRRARATRLAEAKEELFNLRFQHVTGQLDNIARLQRGAPDDRPHPHRAARARDRRGRSSWPRRSES